jgi:hypothetical protein
MVHADICRVAAEVKKCLDAYMSGWQWGLQGVDLRCVPISRDTRIMVQTATFET